MFNKIRQFFSKSPQAKRKEKILKECGCICYCPYCHEPLNDSAFVQELEPAIYKYLCTKCEKTAIFHFGIAPCPIHLEK